MVDSVSGIGRYQLVSGAAKKAAAELEDKKLAQAPAKTDEVSISREALDLQEAERNAARARELLAHSNETLGLKAGFEE